MKTVDTSPGTLLPSFRVLNYFLTDIFFFFFFFYYSNNFDFYVEGDLFFKLQILEIRIETRYSLTRFSNEIRRKYQEFRNSEN